jgi:hypothetical protein
MSIRMRLNWAANNFTVVVGVHYFRQGSAVVRDQSTVNEICNFFVVYATSSCKLIHSHYYKNYHKLSRLSIYSKAPDKDIPRLTRKKRSIPKTSPRAAKALQRRVEGFAEQIALPAKAAKQKPSNPQILFKFSRRFRREMTRAHDARAFAGTPRL